MYPKYSYPSGLFARVALDAALLRYRNFRTDARACIGNLHPPLKVLGDVNIPQRGPCVVTVNHYCRDGFGAQWIALAVAATVPIDMHWIMTAEWTFPGKWHAPVGRPLSRFLLQCLAKIYGFTSMPPMPPHPKDVEARAKAVRAVLDVVKRTKDPIIGIAPEGRDSPTGVLAQPASGAGRFGLLLSNVGLKFVPVGVYEEEGIFTIHFGEAYGLKIGRGLSPEEKDAQAAQVIMKNIALLLPSHLRGEFA